MTEQPYATKAELAHIDEAHGGLPPYGTTEPVTFEDGCVLTPVHDGEWDYEAPPA
jgi:hypothetical protein